MPNWCSNTLTLGHEDPAMIKRVTEAAGRQQLLNEFFPVPEELQIVAGSVGDAEEQRKLEEATKQNVEKYGYGNWYDFCVNEWGTKWDVDAEVLMVDGDKVDLSFDSAWSPPIGWYERMKELGFYVDAYYYEPGSAFCGHWSDGDDEMWEIPSTSEETRESIPQDIDDMFGISESQYEWEQENREELQAWIEDAVEARKEA